MNLNHNNVSVEEAVGILMGLPWLLSFGGRPRIRAQLEGAIGSCLEELREAESIGDEERIRQCTTNVESADQTYRQGEKLYTILCGEVARLRQGRPSEIVIVRDEMGSEDYDQVLISRQSVSDWANRYNTPPETTVEPRSDIPSIEPTKTADSLQEPEVKGSWEDVRIDFRAHDKLFLRLPDGKSKMIELLGSDLINKKNKNLNTKGAALLLLASARSLKKKRGPAGPGISGKDMSHLRTFLRQLIDIDMDPFYPHNAADGWKPRFKVRDRRNAADQRAKEKAYHTSYNDEVHGQSEVYEDLLTDSDEDRAATAFLEGKG